MSAPHQTTIRVYYEDTDWSGCVYHANYLRFMERGRTDFLRSKGIAQSALHREHGLLLVVGRMAVDYLRPARMDDVLTVTTSVETARGPLIRLRQRVARDSEVLTRATVTVVALRDGRPARLSAELLALSS